MLIFSRHRGVWLWGPVVAYMAGIFFMSSLESPPIPSDVPDVNLHAAAYFGLMLLVVRAIAQGAWARVTFGVLASAWILTVAYGATDEWHQMYVEGRHAEWRDLAADALGALVAGAGSGLALLEAPPVSRQSLVLDGGRPGRVSAQA